MLSKSELCRKKMLKIATVYLDALCSKTPEVLPLAPNVRATYNGQECQPCRNEVWSYTVRIPERQTFSDPEAGNVVFFGKMTNDVVNFPEFMTDDKFHYAKWFLYMLRLKIEDGLITEIEELSIDTPTHTKHTIEDAQVYQMVYDIPLPEEEQMSREEMVRAVDTYWVAITKTIPGQSMECHPDGVRWEQGEPATDTARFPYSLVREFEVGRFHWHMPKNERRYPIVDVKRGVVVSIVIMGNAGPRRGAIVWEAFKFSHGLIKCMHCGYQVLIEHSGWALDCGDEDTL